MVSYRAQECSCKQHFSLHCPLDPLVFLTRGLGSAGISWWCVIVENITKERSTCDRLEHCSVRAVGLLGLLGLGVKKPTPAAAVTAPPSDTSPSLGVLATGPCPQSSWPILFYSGQAAFFPCRPLKCLSSTSPGRQGPGREVCPLGSSLSPPATRLPSSLKTLNFESSAQRPPGSPPRLVSTSKLSTPHPDPGQERSSLAGPWGHPPGASTRPSGAPQARFTHLAWVPGPPGWGSRSPQNPCQAAELPGSLKRRAPCGPIAVMVHLWFLRIQILLSVGSIFIISHGF